MKKYLPYIIGLAVLIILVVLISANKRERKKEFSDRITLKRGDKIPYGTYVARDLLPQLFPDAELSYNQNEPAAWNEIDQYESNQAAILICKEFNADEDEVFHLMQFAKNGNYAYIIANELSFDAGKIFNTLITSPYYITGYGDKNLKLRLEKPPFNTDKFYNYPGKKFYNLLYDLDTSRTTVLGRNEQGNPNFVRFDIGEGSIFLHLAPLAFSNYFILHKDNVHYYEQALSVIPKDVEKMVWSEYFLSKPDDRRDENKKQTSWLRILMQYDSFKWGLLTTLFTILLFALMEMRRKQRLIPAYARPQNDSLDFIKTIGRLYHDRKDHHNLARKMSTYFLEHVRTSYKLPTHTLDEKFVQALHFKSGYEVSELNKIMGFIQYLEDTQKISEDQLSQFYKQLESFYGTT